MEASASAPNCPLPKRTDFLVVGGGILGVTISRELARCFPGRKIAVIEKESEIGTHASGRNSGILHAGFYYSADSLKAKFTKDGNAALTAYCLERGLRINRCGKLVVAQTENDLAGLDELLRRGRVNAVMLDELTAKEAAEIEPRIRTLDRAIFSPTTAAVDPVEVTYSLARDA